MSTEDKQLGHSVIIILRIELGTCVASCGILGVCV